MNTYFSDGFMSGQTQQFRQIDISRSGKRLANIFFNGGQSRSTRFGQLTKTLNQHLVREEKYEYNMTNKYHLLVRRQIFRPDIEE